VSVAAIIACGVSGDGRRGILELVVGAPRFLAQSEFVLARAGILRGTIRIDNPPPTIIVPVPGIQRKFFATLSAIEIQHTARRGGHRATLARCSG